ncbi:MAG: hypothetical protein FJY67_10630 [Calditrichaeota bacterium]|nr:hypothetical protein [Calditrichota bacterium]
MQSEEQPVDESRRSRNYNNLLILFGIAFVLRVGIILTTPLYPAEGIVPGYNDEPLHLNYIRHITEAGTWPVYQPSLGGTGNRTAEFLQPPLYYLLSAPVWHWGEAIVSGKGLYAVRILSALLGLAAGIAAMRLASLTIGPAIASSAAVFLLYFPAALYFTSLVTNDALLLLLVLMSLVAIAEARKISEMDDLPRHLILSAKVGALLGLSCWAKLSGLLLIPLALASAPVGFSRKQAWAVRATALATAIALVIPLLTWNYTHYGHLVPLAGGYGPTDVTSFNRGALFHPWAAAKHLFHSAAVPNQALWGGFPEVSASAIFTLALLVFLGRGLVTILRSGRDRWWLLALLTLTLVGFAVHSIRFFQVEFRLLIPAFGSLAILMMLGWGRLRPGDWLLALLLTLPWIISMIY